MYTKEFDRKGRLICFEGIDRSGKSSQIEILSLYLIVKNIPYVIIKFPTNETYPGREINKFLKGEIFINPDKVDLYFTSDRLEMYGEIKRLLKEGTWVICDRYVYSGIAYGNTALYFNTLEFGKVVRPDLVIFMDVQYEDVKNRKDFGKEIYEEKNRLERAYKNFLKWFEDKDFVKIIDGRKGIREISEEIEKEIEGIFTK